VNGRQVINENYQQAQQNDRYSGPQDKVWESTAAIRVWGLVAHSEDYIIAWKGEMRAILYRDEAIMSETEFEERLEDVKKRIVEAFEPQRIILFGSYVYGKSTPNSDVDLLIVMESDERPVVRAARVSKLLRPRPFPMDIMVRTPDEIRHRLSIGDQFIREILERGKVLYERDVSARMGSQS
jgi:predicted nucleotidyltransferase